MPSSIKLTADRLQEICNYYANNSLSATCRKFNYSRPFIKKIISSQGIKIRSTEEVCRKYNVDHSYFDKIDTEEKSYFLGYLFADGNVANASNKITLKLNIKDIEIVRKLSHAICGKDAVKLAPQNGCYYSFSSANCKNKLISYGCTPKKSLTLRFPTCVPESLLHHFIRGYFDGDGSILASKKDQLDRYDGKAYFISTSDFCLRLKEILENRKIYSKVKEDNRLVSKGNNITKYLAIDGNLNILNLYNYMYSDASLYLSRKKDKFELIKKSVEKFNPKKNRLKKRLSEDQIKDICNDYVNGLTVPDIALNYGFSNRFVYKLLESCGIARRSKEECRVRGLNINYLDSIDSEEKAQILGILFAKATVDFKKYQIAINGADKFLPMLKMLSSVFYGSDKVKANCNNINYLTINSKYLVSKLYSYGFGVKEDQSLPVMLGKYYLNFLEGYVIGSGVSVSKRIKVVMGHKLGSEMHKVVEGSKLYLDGRYPKKVILAINNFVHNVAY